jgi:hypothetical protein
LKAEEQIFDFKYYLVVIFIYLSIFINSFIFFREPVEFYFGYLIYILLLPVFFRRYTLSRDLFIIFLILFITGIVNIAINNNTSAQFFKVFIGLALSYFFYYFVIVDFNYDIERLFKWYLKGAYLAALIGVIQFASFQMDFTPGYNYSSILNKWSLALGGNFGIRINSIFAEPTHLGTVLSAAFFVSAYNLIRKETYYLSRFQSLVIVLIYILSFSGLGQAGILVTLLFLAVSFGLFRYILIFIPLGILVFSLMYNNSRDFKERLDSLVDLFGEGKFVLGKTHGSSFVLYNNFVVATENFKSNFVFGTGIGSHPTAFEKYSTGKAIKAAGFNINSSDANSMLLRIISETGLFGVFIFLYLVIKCYVQRDPDNESFHWLVSNSILIMILLNLFRQGHYFLNGFPFFVLLYIYNGIAYKQYLENLEINSIEIPEEDSLILKTNT